MPKLVYVQVGSNIGTFFRKKIISSDIKNTIVITKYFAILSVPPIEVKPYLI